MKPGDRQAWRMLGRDPETHEKIETPNEDIDLFDTLDERIDWGRDEDE